MRKALFLLAIAAASLAAAAPRTAPSVPVIGGVIRQNAVLTDAEGQIFLEFLKDTYVVDPGNQGTIRGIYTPEDNTETPPDDTSEDERDAPPTPPVSEDDSADADELAPDFDANADEIRQAKTTAARAPVFERELFPDSDILPPELMEEPAPNERPYTRFLIGFRLYTSAFRDAAFTDRSRSKTKGVKLLYVPPADAGHVQLWEWSDGAWRRLGGRTETAESGETGVFTAYIDGTGQYALYDERPAPNSADAVRLADDLVKLKPFTVPDELSEQEAINYHLTEIERYKFLQEALGTGEQPPADETPTEGGDETTAPPPRQIEPDTEDLPTTPTPDAPVPTPAPIDTAPDNTLPVLLEPIALPTTEPLPTNEAADVLAQNPDVEADIQAVLDQANGIPLVPPAPVPTTNPSDATDGAEAPEAATDTPAIKPTSPEPLPPLLPQTGATGNTFNWGGLLFVLFVFAIGGTLAWGALQAKKR